MVDRNPCPEPSLAGLSRRSWLAGAGLLGAWAAGPALGQLRIEVSDLGAAKLPIALPTFRGEGIAPHRISEIVRADLERSGLFDTRFRLYGWEDLELGERLRQMGVVLVRCPEAVGYHWHPPLSLDQVPRLIAVEGERAKMGLVFYRKHPTRRVRFIIQFTLLHRLLWELLTLGGLLNERSLKPLLAWLIRQGKPGLAMELLRLPLNRLGVRALYAEAHAAGLR